MTDPCGDLWPDQLAPDGKDVTCQLDAGHGGLWHSWWHELHVRPGKRYGDGRYDWPTKLGLTVMGEEALTPTVVKRPHFANGRYITHVVVRHPKHVALHTNKPDKPVRR